LVALALVVADHAVFDEIRDQLDEDALALLRAGQIGDELDHAVLGLAEEPLDEHLVAGLGPDFPGPDDLLLAVERSEVGVRHNGFSPCKRRNPPRVGGSVVPVSPAWPRLTPVAGLRREGSDPPLRGAATSVFEGAGSAAPSCFRSPRSDRSRPGGEERPRGPFYHDFTKTQHLTACATRAAR